jgi:hypothetical protein
VDDDVAAGSAPAVGLRLHELVGRVLASSTEAPLARREDFSIHADVQPGGS